MKQFPFFSKVAVGLLVVTFCVILCSDAKKTTSSRKCGRRPACKQGKVCVKTDSTFSCKRKVIRPVQHEGEAGGAAGAAEDPECAKAVPQFTFSSFFENKDVQGTLKDGAAGELPNYPEILDNSKVSFEDFFHKLEEFFNYAAKPNVKTQAVDILKKCEGQGSSSACQKIARSYFFKCSLSGFERI